MSNIPACASVPLRGRVVQFPETFVADAIKVFPELGTFKDILEMSRRGALFTPASAAGMAPLLEELVSAQGVRRIELFINLVGAMCRASGTRTLASANYLPDPSSFMAIGINEALAHINSHLTEQFTETDLAAISGKTASAFSRSFLRHTGMALVQYVNRLRVNLACQLLMSENTFSITDICFEVGFNNISNFNRQFD